MRIVRVVMCGFACRGGVSPIGVKLRIEKNNKIGLIEFAIIAPKGRNKIAQGNALGLAFRAKQALKGRHKV